MKGLQESRIKKLNDYHENRGNYVLYWMQQSQRAEFNHALEYAICQANRLEVPPLVVFGLMDDYPEANLRHYRFMLEGLRETQEQLRERGIRFVVRKGEPHEVARNLAAEACLIVCDRGYLRHQRAWRQDLAASLDCPLIQVESDVVVPVEVTSEKAEYAARTIRPKVMRQLDDFLVELESHDVEFEADPNEFESLDLSDLDKVTDKLSVAADVPPVSQFFRGGTLEARKRFATFLEESLGHYAQNRNQPQTDYVSHMSPYLHFGQISPIYLAMKASEKESQHRESVETFIEELVVRRELAINFTEFNPDYDDYDCLPDWALKTLGEHRDDHREYLYSQEELEEAKTHDPYWNAAMREMRCTGFMHNYMRMYWGKKILEWSEAPEKGFATAIEINNKYFLDGRDPNSYAGVAWVFGVHDRAWAERPIFGKVRYMAASGLERKCDIEAYVEKVDCLCQES